MFSCQTILYLPRYGSIKGVQLDWNSGASYGFSQASSSKSTQLRSPTFGLQVFFICLRKATHFNGSCGSAENKIFLAATEFYSTNDHLLCKSIFLSILDFVLMDKIRFSVRFNILIFLFP